MYGKKKNYKYNNLCSGFQNLSLNHSSYHCNVSRPSVNPNEHIIDNLDTKPVWYRNLHPSEDEYQEITNLIEDETVIIENIVQVNNDTLKNAYKKKKKQKKRHWKGQVEDWLFHGTSKANVNGICTYNFDWRLFGTNCGHRFGKGVAFSPNAMYASKYSDKDYHKVMILADVLVANACEGYEDMSYPPKGYDASTNPAGSVIVKYDDNEFYPSYKIYYHIDEMSDDDDYYYDNEDYYDDDEYYDEDGDDYYYNDDYYD